MKEAERVWINTWKILGLLKSKLVDEESSGVFCMKKNTEIFMRLESVQIS